MSILKELSQYKQPAKPQVNEEYEDLLESIEDLMEKFSLSNKDKLTEGKLTMSKATVVKLASGDAGVELKGHVFGIRNDNPIVAFLLEALGVPSDGLAIKIRSGFMQYDSNSKMLFIAKFKSDLPNNRSGLSNEPE